MRRRVDSAVRLAAFLAVLLAAILSITAYETVHVFSDQSIAATTRNLVAQLDSYEQATRGIGTTRLETTTIAYLQSQAIPQGESVMMRLPDGARLGSAGSATLLRTPTIAAHLAHPPVATQSYRSELHGVDTLYLVAPMKVGKARLGTMIVASNLSQLHSDQERVLVLVIGEAMVALIGAVAGAYLLLRRLLRNVGRITTTAASIESGNLDRRLGDQGTDDEVGQLAATFDSMLDRLQAAMTVQRRLLSDVSHQLRTPLTVARGHLEVLARQPDPELDEVRETTSIVVDELDHMASLVERLLMLGRTLEPDFLDVQDIDLRAFVSDLYESAQVLAPRQWSMAPVPDLVVDGDMAKLRGALLNLIDNAVKATGTPDTIEIAADWDPDRWTLALSVEDSGPGIPPDQMARALERFGRIGAADREGSGLGLAIVGAVAEAHGGHFELGRSRLGGCRAAVILPGLRVSAHPAVTTPAVV